MTFILARSEIWQCKSTYNKNYNREKRDISKDLYAPWKFPIKYYVEDPVNSKKVEEAIEIISKNTCVNFTKEEKTFNNEQGLIFKSGSACSSNVGLADPNKPQVIYLTKGCYDNSPYILHEIGHALGLIHEQSRRDRDKYVQIYLSNVHTSERNNFQILGYDNYKNYSTSYDYYSLMHYHPTDFAIDKKKDVITSKTHELYNKMMGQRKNMTFNEFKLINLCHCNTCNWVDDDGNRNKKYNGITCRNSGYPDFKTCGKCICPTGYTGEDCSVIDSSDLACGSTKFKARSYNQNLFFYKKMICNVFIVADRRKKIKIQVHFSNTPTGNICTEDISNQIKHRRDKGNTGLLLCGQHKKIKSLKSESNSALIIYRGYSSDSVLILTFKQFSRRTNSKKAKLS
uniref:Metalloendopeptidase n=1 Tax=Strongyloides papillosus TaxID=174720 RepID=A0A0N5BF06_STREA